jgi:hypothetical protein
MDPRYPYFFGFSSSARPLTLEQLEIDLSLRYCPHWEHPNDLTVVKADTKIVWIVAGARVSGRRSDVVYPRLYSSTRG